MATPLDPKQIVSFEELLMSQVVQQEALKKGGKEMKKILLLAMVIGLLFLPLIVFALDKVDISKISGLSWGASEKEFEAKGGKTLGRDNTGWSQGRMKNVNGVYQFFNSKFFFVELKIPTEDFQFLKKEFTQKYGRPTAEKDFHGIEYSFVWKAGSVEICLYEGGNGEIGLQYTYQPIEVEWNKVVSDRIKENKIKNEQQKKERYKNF